MDFFPEFESKRTPRPPKRVPAAAATKASKAPLAAEASGAAEETGPQVFSVSELTQTVRALLEGNLGRVWVEGEVSNYRRQSSGHQYFTLKDEGSQLSCVLFARGGGGAGWRRGAAGAAAVALADGMCVRAFGAVTVYAARGQYQMNVQTVQAAGAGLRQAQFEALKRKLESEGLFDPERKRALPAFPTRVAIVTSPTGSVLRDMLNILTRRSPWVQVVISPVRVQGEGAAGEIAAAVAELTGFEAAGLGAPDLIVLARGGGSAEDLWEFNEEVVARAVAGSAIPVISAVGHETDFSICDFVADLRAPTPSAAAELATPDRTEILRRLEDRATRTRRCAEAAVRHARQQVAGLMRSGLFREPRQRVDEAAQRVDLALEGLRRAARERLGRGREELAAITAFLRQHRPDRLVALRRQALEALAPRLRLAGAQRLEGARRKLEKVEILLRLLSPLATLQRGYSLAFTAEGALLRSPTQVGPGARLRLQVADGDVRVRVEAARG